MVKQINQVHPEDLQTLYCKHCKNPYFDMVYICKKSPVLNMQIGLAPDLIGEQPSITLVQRFECTKCGIIYKASELVKQNEKTEKNES